MTLAETSIRARWAGGETAYGGWCMIPDGFIAEVVASQGFDYVCIDLQHGTGDFAAVNEMLPAIRSHGSSPLVRVPSSDPAFIGRVLDAGAAGVIIPLVHSSQQAAAVVHACRYPPKGGRSFGPSRAKLAYGSVDPSVLDDVVVAVMVESAEGLDSVEDIAAVPGLDAIYVGPIDLAIALGLPPVFGQGSPHFDDALDRIRAACDRNGIAAGIHCPNGAIAATFASKGFSMVTVAVDSNILAATLRDELAKARGAAPIEDGSTVSVY